MMFLNRRLLAATMLASVFVGSFALSAKAEDCVGTLPGTDCTLDEDTTAPLTLDDGVTLFTSGSVTLDHTVDGSTVVGDGTISTADGGSGDTITQNADIGSSIGIDQLVIDEDDTWVTSAEINTDNTGADIDLGAGDGGEEIHFLSGSSFLGEIDGHSGDIVDFGADGNGGDFEVITDIEGVSVVLTSGTLDVRSSIGTGTGLGSLTVSEDTNLNLFSSATVSGALDIDGDVYIDAGATLRGDTYVVDSEAANYTLGVQTYSGSTTAGAIEISNGGPVDFSADSLSFQVDEVSQPLAAGTINSVIVGNGGATIAPNYTDQSYLYNFQLVADGDDFDLVISVNDLDDVTTNANNEAVARVFFEDFAETEEQGINRIQSLLGNDSTQSEFNERLESLLPTMDAGYINASYTMSHEAQKSVYRRVSLDRDMNDLVQDDVSGGEVVFAAGSKDMRTGTIERYKAQEAKPYKSNLWGHVFRHFSSQSSKQVDGYNMDGNGIILGVDMPNMRNDVLLGAAVMLGNTNLESDNANRTDTNINNTGVSLYAAKKLMDGTMLSGVVNYIHSNNSIVRHDVGGVSGAKTTATFKSEHLALQGRLSRNYWLQNDWRLNASISLGYDYHSTDAYDEGGNSAAAMNIAYDSVDRLSAGVHLALGKLYKLQAGEKYVYPSAYVSYEFSPINTKLKSTATISDSEDNDPSVFEVSGNDPVKHDLEIGTNVKLLQGNNMTFDAGYALGLNEYSQDHAVSANMTYAF